MDGGGAMLFGDTRSTTWPLGSQTPASTNETGPQVLTEGSKWLKQLLVCKLKFAFCGKLIEECKKQVGLPTEPFIRPILQKHLVQSGPISLKKPWFSSFIVSAGRDAKRSQAQGHDGYQQDTLTSGALG